VAERSSLTQIVQLAVETTPGVAVTDGFKQLQSIGIEPSPTVEMDRFRPMGQKYQSFTTLGKEWVQAALSGRLTYTEIVYMLSSIVDTATITTPGGATLARNWNFQSNPTNDDAYKTFSVKHGSSVRADEFTHGLVTELGFQFSRNSVEVSGSMLGKALTDNAVLATTGGVGTAPDPGLDAALALVPVIPTQVSIYLDDSSGALGTTKLTRALSADWSLGSRFAPVWPIDAALGTGFAAIVETEPDLSVSLSLEADTQGMARLPEMRNGTTKYLRIEAVGAEIDGGAADYKFTLDTCVEIVDTGGFNDNEGIYTVDWQFVAVNDPSWGTGKAFDINVVNLLTAL
jgi:hypothetical protein